MNLLLVCALGLVYALIFKGKIIYCVEFKNSFKESVRVKDIQNKLQGDYHVLSGIFTELKLKITDYKLIFCVVHKVNTCFLCQILQITTPC
jgi:hypothetical protein